MQEVKTLQFIHLLTQYDEFGDMLHFTDMITSLACLHTLLYPCAGNGRAPVGFPVFKTGGGLLCRPRWVRLPSIPASIFNCHQVSNEHNH
jgi:hypothetical protein